MGVIVTEGGGAGWRSGQESPPPLPSPFSPPSHTHSRAEQKVESEAFRVVQRSLSVEKGATPAFTHH